MIYPKCKRYNWKEPIKIKTLLLFILLSGITFLLPLVYAAPSLTGIANHTYSSTDTPICTDTAAASSLYLNDSSSTYNNTVITLGVAGYKWTCNSTGGNVNVIQSITKTQPVLILNNNTASVNTSGLVGYWRFEEGTGTTASDSSVYGNTGTLYNSPTWLTNSCMFGDCLNFSGGTDLVNVSNSPSLNITNAITVAAWVNDPPAEVANSNNYESANTSVSTSYPTSTTSIDSSSQAVPEPKIVKTFGNTEIGNTSYPTQTLVENSPIEILSANLSKIDVKPGDILTVTVEAKSEFGIKEIIADMGGIENITLQKISGDIYQGTWQNTWNVHSTEEKNYTVTLYVRDNAGNELIDKSLSFTDPSFGITSTGSTSYPSIGAAAKTVTPYGNAQIDTAQSKFGGASGLFDGTGDYLTLTASPNWNFGTGDLTIDTWFRANSFAAEQLIMSQSTAPTETYIDLVSATRIDVQIGGAALKATTVSAMSTNTWYHLAVVRASGTVKLYLNGVEKSGGWSAAGNTGDSTGSLYIAVYSNLAGSYNGWLDEFRVTKGVARWTSNFAPPAAAYNSDTSTVLLLHMDGTDASTTFTDSADKRISGYTRGTRVQYTGATTGNGAVSSFSFYTHTGSASDHFTLAFYDDSAGSPNHRLWYSASTGSASTTWNNVTYASGTADNGWAGALTQNAYYWFMWQWDNTDSGPSYAVGGANTGIYKAQTYGTLDSTWSGGTLSTENWSMFATYNTPPTFTSISSPTVTYPTATSFSTVASPTSPSTTVTLYVCKSNDGTSSGCGAGGTWCSSSAVSSNPSCTLSASPGAGTWNYYAYIFDNNNLGATNNPISQSFTVNKGTLSGTLSTPTVTYPTALSVSSTAPNTIGTDVAYRIYCDNTLMASATGSAPSGSVVLAAGGHSCLLNTTAGPFVNWTASSSFATSTGTVNKGTLNGTITGSSVTYPDAVNIIPSESNNNVGTDVNYTFWRNNTLVSSAVNGNPSADTSQFTAGTYVYILNSTGGANWTSNSSIKSLTIVVSKAVPVLILNNNTAAVNTSGLVGYWRFENESLGTATDYSGWNNTGTLANMNNGGNSTSGPTNAGRFGKGMQFDGVNDFLQVDDKSQLNMGTSNFSINFWIKTSYSGVDRDIVIKGTAAPFYVVVLSYGIIYTCINDNLGAGSKCAVGTIQISDSSWHFVSVVFNRSSNVTIYIDGSKDVSSTISAASGSLSNSNDFFRVGKGDLSGGYFNGTIDEVQIWNRSLIADEINELYQSSAKYNQNNFTGSNCPTGQSDVSCNLYRNDSSVSNPDTQSLGVGSYYYIYNTSGGQNYTQSAILLPLNVTQGTSWISFLINATTAKRGDFLNVTINSSSTPTANITRPNGSVTWLATPISKGNNIYETNYTFTSTDPSGSYMIGSNSSTNPNITSAYSNTTNVTMNPTVLISLESDKMGSDRVIRTRLSKSILVYGTAKYSIDSTALDGKTVTIDYSSTALGTSTTNSTGNYNLTFSIPYDGSYFLNVNISDSYNNTGTNSTNMTIKSRPTYVKYRFSFDLGNYSNSTYRIPTTPLTNVSLSTNNVSDLKYSTDLSHAYVCAYNDLDFSNGMLLALAHSYKMTDLDYVNFSSNYTGQTANYTLELRNNPDSSKLILIYTKGTCQLVDGKMYLVEKQTIPTKSMVSFTLPALERLPVLIYAQYDKIQLYGTERFVKGSHRICIEKPGLTEGNKPLVNVTRC